MPQKRNRLTPGQVEWAVKDPTPCDINDGDGLYLSVSKADNPVWQFSFKIAGSKQLRRMELGSYPEVSLADARERASQARRFIKDGIDPIEQRRKERERNTEQVIKHKTFEAATLQFIGQNRSRWNNSKSAQQWKNSLESYAFPKIGNMSVQKLSTEWLALVLQPIWYKKHPTARRVRGRIEAIIEYSDKMGWHRGDNPARLQGDLQRILAIRPNAYVLKHHPGLLYSQIPTFMQELRARRAMSARALEFLVLTARRTSEVIGSKWSEFNLKEGVWTVEASRTLEGRNHRVPLSKSALKLLSELPPKENSFVFPGGTSGHLSNMAMLELLKRMKLSKITVHGFRSTFRKWAHEATNTDNKVIEMALSHRIRKEEGAKTKQNDLLRKRKPLMAAWAHYCS